MKNCSNCGAAFDGAFSLCPECAKQQKGKDVNYYDDVLPEDGAQQKRKKADTGTAAKIAITVFGVILVIAACVAILTLL